MDLQRAFRVGEFTVHPSSGEIFSGGILARLEPKVMEVLLVLADEAPAVALRSTLLDRVWGPRAEISDEPLNRCVRELRRALGDSARNPEYVQTIPTRGYRLLKPVTPLEPDAAVAGAIAPGAAERALPVPLFRRRGVIAAGGAAAVLGFGVALLANPDRWLRMFGFSTSQDSEYEPHPDAANYYNRANDAIKVRSYEALVAAIGFLDDAIEIDNRFVEAYIQWAFVAVLLPYYASTLGDADKQNAQDYFDGAADQLSRGLGWPHTEDLAARAQGIRAFISHVEWNWKDAAERFGDALLRAQDDADLFHRYASFLSDTGQLEAALHYAELATNADKDSGVFLERQAVINMWLGNYGDARELFEAALRDTSKPRNPDAELVFLYCEGKFADPGNFGKLENKLDELNEKLNERLGLARASVDWISPLIAALESAALQSSDAQTRKDDAIGAINEAKRFLPDKYVYGAYVFLEEWDSAIRAAINIAEHAELKSQLDIDLLWSEIGHDLRTHDPDRFEELLIKTGLSDYFDGAGWPTSFCDRKNVRIVCS